MKLFCAFFFWFLAESFGEIDLLRKRDLGIQNICRRIHIEILVSPLVQKGAIRRLEIQWEYAPKNPGDWIGLFRTDPLISYHGNFPTPMEKVPVTSVHGWANTTILEEHNEPEHLGFRGKCLDYYAGYFNNNNDTLAVTCLRIEPNWMWNLKEEIGPRRLRNVFIPGTHDSAAYEEYDDRKGDTRVKKYTITQDESLLGQLIYGSRYLDLRIGYYASINEPWWANHGVVRIHPLRTVLKDIRNFLINTNEIVILDIQEFPVGFINKDVHYLLVRLLEKELGDLAVPPTLSWDSTFEQVWNTGRRLIIGYDDQEVVAESHFLWQSVQQKWGNVQTLNNLYTYLAGLIERPPLSSWSAMAELTPTALDVILDRLKGLRVMAESVNHNVTEWFRRREWQPKTNIVSVDFIRNTGIIRSAIEWNKHQGQCTDDSIVDKNATEPASNTFMMQSLRFKFGDRRSDWKCCFCCHVRTGTIFIGVWNLMLHVMALSVMAVMFSYPKQDLDPVLPTPLSEVDNINFEVSGSNVEVTLNDGSSIKHQPLLPHSYRDLWEHRTLSNQDMNVGVVVTFCTFAMTLMLLYGAVKGKPSYLMPFFCLQIFDFFVTSISAVGYLCYPTDINRLLTQSNHIPLREEFMNLHPQTLGVFAAILFLVIISVKAYFIGVVWSCYKYLTLRQIAAQRTVQFIDPDVQNLLPDLPDYETAVKKYPTPPPSYTTAVMGQYPVVETNGVNLSLNPQPLSAQTMIVPPVVAASAPVYQTPGTVNSPQQV